MNYQERLFKALKSECEANINEALLTLDLCFHNGVAIGEHTSEPLKRQNSTMCRSTSVCLFGKEGIN